MVSKQQRIEIDQKILKCVEIFLTSGETMEELSTKTKIPSSSVQRYLNSKRIIELIGQDAYDEVQKKLKENTLEARSKGGTISTIKNTSVRDDDGKFIGNIKR